MIYLSDVKKVQIIPIIAIALILLSGYVHMSVYNIKVIDRKLTMQHYNWHGGVYEWDERKGLLTWEDADISISPDYTSLLQEDLNTVAAHIEHIDSIDASEMTFSKNGYDIRVCVEEMNIDIVDTSLFSKNVKAELVAYLELSHGPGCDPIYSHTDFDRRFKITDEFEVIGFGHENFLINKGYELLYTEIADLTDNFVFAFERPYALRAEYRATMTMLKMMYDYNPYHSDNVAYASPPHDKSEE